MPNRAAALDSDSFMDHLNNLQRQQRAEALRDAAPETRRSRRRLLLRLFRSKIVVKVRGGFKVSKSSRQFLASVLSDQQILRNPRSNDTRLRMKPDRLVNCGITWPHSFELQHAKNSSYLRGISYDGLASIAVIQGYRRYRIWVEPHQLWLKERSHCQYSHGYRRRDHDDRQCSSQHAYGISDWLRSAGQFGKRHIITTHATGNVPLSPLPDPSCPPRRHTVAHEN